MTTPYDPVYSINPTHATHTLVKKGEVLTFTPRLGKDAGDLGSDYVKIFHAEHGGLADFVVVWNTDTRTWKLEKGLRVWSADDAREIWNACISRGWRVAT